MPLLQDIGAFVTPNSNVEAIKESSPEQDLTQVRTMFHFQSFICLNMNRGSLERTSPAGTGNNPSQKVYLHDKHFHLLT